MFDFKKEQKTSTDLDKTTEQESLKKETALANNESVFNAGNIKVHTMPEKFFSGNSKKIAMVDKDSNNFVTGHKKTIILGVIIGVLVIALIALGAWFLLKSLEQPVTTNQPVVKEDNNQEKNNSVVKEDSNSVNTENDCSLDNCSACSVEDCQKFNDNCHVEDACLIDTNLNNSICPNFVCLSGAVQSENNTENIMSGEIVLMPAKDSDQDMLSDVEENLWGTNPAITDTDGDKYTDGQEVKNLYSPVVAGSEDSAKLIGSKLVKEFVNNKFGYNIYYPASWLLEDLKNNSEEIVFKASNDEFIEVIVENLTEEYGSAKEWYLFQNTDINEQDLQEVLIGNWSGVKSSDGLSIYLIRNNNLYVLTYNVGLNTSLTYQTTFDMMLKTFKFFESPL